MDAKARLKVAYAAYRRAKETRAPAETVERLLLSFIKADYQVRAGAQS